MGFFNGRNGYDPLNTFLLIVGCIPLVLMYILGLPFLYYISAAIWIYTIFRAFSRNLDKRQAECEKFLSIFHRQDRKSPYKFYKCKCGKTLRVPRGKGKIMITCPVCSNVLIKKT